MKNITITEVNEMLETARNYFKGKLLKGEFEVVEQRSHTIKLKIDGYVFTIWTGNIDIKESRKQYSNSEIGTSEPIDLKITDEEAIILDRVLKPIIKQYIQDVEIKELEDRLNNLRNH